MKNNEVLDSLVILEGVRFVNRCSKEELDNTLIDFKKWIKKCKKLNIDLDRVMWLLFEVIEHHKDDMKDFYKFERAFDFIFSTIRGIDLDIDMGTKNWLICGVLDFNDVERMLKFSSVNNKTFVINGEELEIVYQRYGVDLVNKENGKVVYEDVEGIVKDFKTNEVEVICGLCVTDDCIRVMKKEKDKCKISFVDEYGHLIV